MDSAVLGRMVEEVRQNLPWVTSLLVVRHGYLVLEEHFGGNPAALMATWCVSKSVLSCLLGIARGQGRLRSVEQAVLSFFPEYKNKPPVQPSAKKLTIRHLLTMSSGLGASFPTQDPRLIESAVTYPPINEPGVKFTYNDHDSAVVSLLIAKATKQETVAYAPKHLFAPLGIEEFSRGEDKPFSGGAADLCLILRDMATIGTCT